MWAARWLKKFHHLLRHQWSTIMVRLEWNKCSDCANELKKKMQLNDTPLPFCTDSRFQIKLEPPPPQDIKMIEIEMHNKVHQVVPESSGKVFTLEPAGVVSVRQHRCLRCEPWFISGRIFQPALRSLCSSVCRCLIRSQRDHPWKSCDVDRLTQSLTDLIINPPCSVARSRLTLFDFLKERHSQVDL